MNRVCYKIIREHSKKRKRSEELHDRLKDNGYGDSNITLSWDSKNSDKITILLISLEELKDEDLQILRLRIIQGWVDHRKPNINPVILTLKAIINK